MEGSDRGRPFLLGTENCILKRPYECSKKFAALLGQLKNGKAVAMNTLPSGRKFGQIRTVIAVDEVRSLVAPQQCSEFRVLFQAR